MTLTTMSGTENSRSHTRNLMRYFFITTITLSRYVFDDCLFVCLLLLLSYTIRTRTDNARIIRVCEGQRTDEVKGERSSSLSTPPRCIHSIRLSSAHRGHYLPCRALTRVSILSKRVPALSPAALTYASLPPLTISASRSARAASAAFLALTPSA